MRKPAENMKIFADRRATLGAQIKGSAMIVASHPDYIRNNDVHHSYRQDTNLYYLTGWDEPESILLFRPGMTPETVMFVRERNRERETWDGFRYGPEGAEKEFRADKAYPIAEFEKVAMDLLRGVDSLYYRFYKNTEVDARVENVLKAHKTSYGRSGFGLLTVKDADEVLGEMRVKKTEPEIHNIRKACELSAESHNDLMKYTRPGMSEREAHGYFLYQSMKRGAAREGYGGIFAGGNNSTTLHYTFNDQTLKSGDVFLVDAGGEYNYFTGDITRTFPVNGKFTEAQTEVYQGVLDVQKHLHSMVKPGLPFQTLQETTISMLTDLMLELGLLTGRKDDIIKSLEYKKYYPHGVSHYLGMDVHDSGFYFSKSNEPRPLEENMVFTIEPGLYIPADDMSVSAEYRGIGVRIEDNVRVTHNGSENMTVKAVKEISEMESIIGTYHR